MKINFMENSKLDLTSSKEAFLRLKSRFFSNQTHCAVLSCINDCSCLKEVGPDKTSDSVFIAVCEEHFKVTGAQVITQNVRHLFKSELIEQV